MTQPFVKLSVCPETYLIIKGKMSISRGFVDDQFYNSVSMGFEYYNFRIYAFKSRNVIQEMVSEIRYVLFYFPRLSTF